MTHLGRSTNMAATAAYYKRRAGLSAILKNHLATVAPRLHSEGVISNEDCEIAVDETASKRERADSLVAAIGKKIKTDEKALQDVLRILQEAGVGRLYVAIMEGAMQRPHNDTGGTYFEEEGRGYNGRMLVRQRVKAR